MTTVHISLGRDDGTDQTAAKGVVEWEPTTRREDGTMVILERGFVAPLVDGEATVIVDPSGLTWCWRVTERTDSGGTVRYVSVPNSATTVEYVDLPDVDPTTLVEWSPADPEAAYQTALDNLDVETAVETYLLANPVSAPVTSVNAQTGAVTLDAADVGADPAGTAAGLVGALTPASIGAATPAQVSSGDSATLAAAQSHAQGLVDALTAASPATLDTLAEIATALGADPNFAATMTAALAARVRFDAAQSLTVGEQAQARSNIGAGTSNLVIGTTAGTAKEGNYAPDLSGLVAKSLVDAKGDLLVATAADTVTRLPASTDGHVLTLDSAKAAGVKWAAPSGGGGTTPVFLFAPIPGTRTLRGNGGQAGIGPDGPFGGFFPSPAGVTVEGVIVDVLAPAASAVLTVYVYDSDPVTGRPSTLMQQTNVDASTAGEKLITVQAAPIGNLLWAFMSSTVGIGVGALGNNNSRGLFLAGPGLNQQPNPYQIVSSPGGANPTVQVHMHNWANNPIFDILY